MKEQNEREKEQTKNSDRSWEERKKICQIKRKGDLKQLDETKEMTLINRTDNQILIGIGKKRTITSAIYVL